MIGIDTNILVRYLTQDDIEQFQAVEKLLEKYFDKPRSIFINNIVMCELVWVLDRGYNYSKAQIAKAARHILSTEEFAFESQNILWLALEQYEHSSIDFADALITRINKQHNCITTFTFDKSAVKSEDFTDCNV